MLVVTLTFILSSHNSIWVAILADELVPLAKDHRFGIELNPKLQFAYLQGSCSSSQPFHEKSTSMFEERDGRNEAFVRLREWLNISKEGTFLREAFISEKSILQELCFKWSFGTFCLLICILSASFPLVWVPNEIHEGAHTIQRWTGSRETRVLSLLLTTCVKPNFLFNFSSMVLSA